MIEVNYDSAQNIVYVKRIGGITAQELVKNIRTLGNSFQGPHGLYIIEDIRKSTSLFSVRDYELLTQEIEIFAPNYKEVMFAIIVDKPSDTAMSLMFDRVSNYIPNFYYNTFCTPEGATAWMRVRSNYRFT